MYISMVDDLPGFEKLFAGAIEASWLSFVTDFIQAGQMEGLIF